MGLMFHLLDKLVATLHRVWVYLWDWNRPVYLHRPRVFFYPVVRRVLMSKAPVLRVLSGLGASSVIPLDLCRFKRPARATSNQATGRWTLVRHGLDSLTPLSALQHTLTDKRR